MATPEAQYDYFLKIDGIDGESQDDEFPKWIEVLSFSWGGASAADYSGGGGTGKLSFQDMSFTADINAASPSLAQLMANGKQVAWAELDIRVAGDPAQVIKKIKLTDVLVSKFLTSGVGSKRPVDSFTLNFGKIEYQYGAQNAKGKVTALDKKMGFDLRTLKPS